MIYTKFYGVRTMHERGLRKILEQKREELTQLFSQNGVIASYLFGSQATRKAGAQSDIDLAVLFDRAIPKDRWRKLKIHLLTELIGIFESNRVDLVALNEAPPFLAYEEIIRSGALIFSKDEDQRLLFEVEAFHRYVDTEPLRRIQQMYLAEEIEEKARTLKPARGIQW